MNNTNSEKKCLICCFPIKEGSEIVYCSQCHLPHHLECWVKNNGCSNYACTGSPLEKVETSSFNIDGMYVITCDACGEKYLNNLKECPFCKGAYILSEELKTGNLSNEQVPPDVKKWNWAPFLMGWMWCFAHRIYSYGIAILIIAFIPYVSLINLPLTIYLGFVGSNLAWKNRKFSSVEEFNKIQKIWIFWGIILWILFFVLMIYVYPDLAKDVKTLEKVNGK